MKQVPIWTLTFAVAAQLGLVTGPSWSQERETAKPDAIQKIALTLIDEYFHTFRQCSEELSKRPPNLQLVIAMYHDPRLVQICSQLVQLMEKHPKSVLMAIAEYQWPRTEDTDAATCYLGEFLYQRFPWSRWYIEKVTAAAVELIFEEKLPPRAMYHWGQNTLSLFMLLGDPLAVPFWDRLTGPEIRLVTLCVNAEKFNHPALQYVFGRKPYATAKFITHLLHEQEKLGDKEAARFLEELEWTNHLVQMVYFRQRTKRLNNDDIRALSKQFEFLASQNHWWLQMYVLHELEPLPQQLFVTQKLAKSIVNSPSEAVQEFVKNRYDDFIPPIGVKRLPE